MSRFIKLADTGSNRLWQYLATIILVFIGWQVIGIIPILVAGILKTSSPALLDNTLEGFMRGENIDANLFLVLMILSFASGLWTLYLGVKWFHNRKFITLITTRRKVDYKRIMFAFILWMGISFLIFFIDLGLHPEHYHWNFQPVRFVILLIISLLLLPLQTSFEEILFRGYLMQGLGRAFKNSILPLIITSIVFGLLHGMNPEVEKMGNQLFIYYIGTGIFFGIITLMDEGLELSLGMHAANNIFAALFVTSEWSVFQTPALFIDRSEPDMTLLAYLPVFVIYPLVIGLLTRKYHWSEWMDKIIR